MRSPQFLILEMNLEQHALAINHINYYTEQKSELHISHRSVQLFSVKCLEASLPTFMNPSPQPEHNVNIFEARRVLLTRHGLSEGAVLLAHADYVDAIGTQWFEAAEESRNPEICFDMACAISAAGAVAPLRIWQVMSPSGDADIVFSDRDYEQFCGDILSVIINKVVRVVSDGPDGGYDLFHEQRFQGYDGFVSLTFGQCKRYHGLVSVQELREFLGIIHTKYAIGYFFTTGHFTRAGIELLRENFNIDHKNLCYYVDSDRQASISVALESFAEAALDLEVGDTAISVSLIQELRSRLTEIVHEHPPARSRQGELF